MSRRDVEPLMHDILTAGQRIVEYTTRKTVDEYVTDYIAHDVAERNFITIGEALMQGMKAFPELATSLTSARGFVAFRHVLTHGYRTIDHRRVWSIIQNDLPLLLAECRSLLGEFPA
jgi:uncharacterized protein with HEPN domain